MNTIQIRIEHEGEVTINNECKAAAPVEMMWFAGNDLVVETRYEKIIFNSANAEAEDGVFIIRPKAAENNLTVVPDVTLKLVRNNVAKFVIINDKYAYRLPGDFLIE